MEKKEIIEQLTQLEKICSNDYELGGFVREFIRNNFLINESISPTELRSRDNKKIIDGGFKG